MYLEAKNEERKRALRVDGWELLRGDGWEILEVGLQVYIRGELLEM